MGLLVRSRRGANGLIRLRDHFLAGYRCALVDITAAATTTAFAPTTTAAFSSAVVAPAAREITAAIARIPAIWRVAVEITPISIATARPTPTPWREQGEEATERSPMPAPLAAPITATVATRITAGIAARVAASATRRAARSATVRFGAGVAIATGSRTARRTGKWSNGASRSARRPAALFATIAATAGTVPVANAGTIAEDGLAQTAAATG